ncbi:MAG: UvrB/UvrC motif-containing protein [Oscillospiraceae bacterium]|nr:UvrB/UvrC motif-containing protein [Oscillospiraceae bacterium]
MLCEHCKKRTATAHITETVNGYTKEMNLCSLCASELSFNGFLNPVSISGLLSSVFTPATAEAPKKKCPLCGRTASQIAVSGEAGCAECYKVFESELLSPITRIHGKARHIGKKPKFSEKEDSVDIIKEKEEKLREAIAAEDFETAASLRDEIRNLKEGKGNE